MPPSALLTHLQLAATLPLPPEQIEDVFVVSRRQASRPAAERPVPEHHQGHDVYPPEEELDIVTEGVASAT